MSDDLQRLVVQIEANMRNYERKMDRALAKTNSTANRMERRFRTAGTNINRAFNVMSRGAVASLGAIGVAVGGVGLANLVRQSLDAAEAIEDMSRRADVGAEFLQELRFAASQNGASTRDFDDAISRLNRRLGLFISDGGGPAAAAFERLGIETRIAGGELRDTESVFEAAVASLQDIESAAERSAIASQLFGEDSGPRLAQLMALGTDGIEAQRQAARDYGVVMSEELVAEASAASDVLERMGMQFNTQINSAIASQAEELVGLADALTQVATWAIRAGANLNTFFDAVSRTLSDRQRTPVTRQQFDNEITDITDAIGDYGGRVVNGGSQTTNLGRLRSFLGQAELDRLVETAGSSTNEQFSQLVLDALIARRDELALLRRDLDRALTTGSPDGSNGSGAGGGGGPVNITDGSPYGPQPADPVRSFAQQLASDSAAWEELQTRMREASVGILEGIAENRDEFARGFAAPMSDAMMGVFDGTAADRFAQHLQRRMHERLFSLFQRLGELLFDRMQGSGGGGFLSQAANFAFGGGKADGGNAFAGRVYRVGERGPETIAMTGNGRVIPNLPKQLSSSRQVVVQQALHLHAEGAVMTDELLREMDMKAAAARQSAVQVSRGDLARMQEQGAMRFGNAY